MLIEKFYSNGKLLITGEYLVLDGAISLALPTKFGQDLTIENSKLPNLTWESFDEKGDRWFHCNFELPRLKSKSDNEIADTLLKILKEAQKLNPKFLFDTNSVHVKTRLSFPRNWGLGTSSTLIANIAGSSKPFFCCFFILSSAATIIVHHP